ncbi:hypothetical protein NC653_020675 [Populus alba x Populus x berolinensis]|uniref:Uncharacterized protein n=1 Tax=Populus alba x Populus x berolinensis TaxID=444605 RepID=A0AAD6MNE8_9ROSI|nr:hypothetical protein NC653_020675 [Populus alba x Populus x berolinensis]
MATSPRIDSSNYRTELLLPPPHGENEPVTSVPSWHLKKNEIVRVHPQDHQRENLGLSNILSTIMLSSEALNAVLSIVLRGKGNTLESLIRSFYSVLVLYVAYMQLGAEILARIPYFDNSEYNFLLGPLQTNILNFHLFDESLDTVWVHSRGSYNKVASQKASALVCYQLLARYDAYTSSNKATLGECDLIRWNLKGVPRVPWEAKGEFQGTLKRDIGPRTVPITFARWHGHLFIVSEDKVYAQRPGCWRVHCTSASVVVEKLGHRWKRNRTVPRRLQNSVQCSLSTPRGFLFFASPSP